MDPLTLFSALVELMVSDAKFVVAPPSVTLPEPELMVREFGLPDPLQRTMAIPEPPSPPDAARLEPLPPPPPPVLAAPLEPVRTL